MSALPPKADMCGALVHVRFVPKADMANRSVSWQALLAFTQALTSRTLAVHGAIVSGGPRGIATIDL
jgi:hypothetical protein